MSPKHSLSPRSRALSLVLAGAVAASLSILSPAPSIARGGPQSVSAVAEKLMDSVVSISTSQAVKGAEGAPLPRVPKGSPFEEFFDDFFGNKGSSRERKTTSLGSGFVIDAKEGLIVTNNHVIDGADEITANFADGTKLKVDKVLGKDAKTRSRAAEGHAGKKPLVEAQVRGSSSDMKIGEWVMAIGNPFGLGGTVTVGVISAKHATSAPALTTTFSRPTPRSTRATPAARCSTWTAKSSA